MIIKKTFLNNQPAKSIFCLTKRVKCFSVSFYTLASISSVFFQYCYYLFNILSQVDILGRQDY